MPKLTNAEKNLVLLLVLRHRYAFLKSKKKKVIPNQTCKAILKKTENNHSHDDQCLSSMSIQFDAFDLIMNHDVHDAYIIMHFEFQNELIPIEANPHFPFPACSKATQVLKNIT